MADKGNLVFSDSIVEYILESPNQPRVTYRLAGDNYLLLEYGDLKVDLNYRFRIHSLEEALAALKIKGLKETIPGVRSLLLYYDSLELSLSEMLHILKAVEKELPLTDELELASRTVYLPIACHDRWTMAAIEEYMGSVRSNAPYLPDNMDFIAKCNGLEKVDEVTKHITATEHMVLGLGDVYLGAPCAIPLDPRYRLAAPKYNPARTWTPEGAVGVGGSFICIYPMESPGGYQLFGRTIPIWNTYQTSRVFRDAPWLLKFFDRIKFQIVSEEELEFIREDVKNDKYNIKIEEGTFKVKKYNNFLDSIKNETEEYRRKQLEATERWTVGY